MIEQFLALSAVEKALVVFAILATAFLGLTRLLGKKKRLVLSIGSNGDAEERPAKTSSTAKLEAMELEWRQEVDGQIQDIKEQLYEKGGAVRLGRHDVRDCMGQAVMAVEPNA